MKILLLHPEDRIPSQRDSLDLIVDLGHAPAAIYAAWRQETNCRVISIFDYASGFADLYALKKLLCHGAGVVVDEHGIDWWEVVLPMLLSDLEQTVMLSRLAGELNSDCQLYCSRPDLRANALHKFLGSKHLLLCKSSSSLGHKARHYRRALSHLDFGQLRQIAQDKLDPEHSIRRRIARRKPGDGLPVFLLPTAYINVSRTAVSYAALLPEERFLLAVARPGGRMNSLPKNVRTISLDAYFGPLKEIEVESLLEKWNHLQRRLVADFPEFRLAELLGMFQRIPGLMHWAMAARDAWKCLFDSENIAACFSADEANPYTSIPLILARRRGIPALAVHHGALDYRLSIKQMPADMYLAKGELERDYLLQQCRLEPNKIAVGSPPNVVSRSSTPGEKPWLVFFTEPYASAGWRIEEVYRDLMPALLALAKDCGLKLIFKLHPFESIKGHRTILRKLLPPSQLSQIQWMAGPASSELWSKICFAMTVESTIALECAAREVPVFLCDWLRSAYGGYSRQYAKFGVGHILNSPDQFADVPKLLADWNKSHTTDSTKIWQDIDPGELRKLLTGSYRSQALTGTRTAS
jgi:hypothetical protein